MKNRIVYFFGTILLISLSYTASYGQCINNPSIQAGSISPAPLAASQNGTLSFVYTENLLDYTEEETSPVKVTICLLNIAPTNGINAVGGTFSGTFDWVYDATLNCLQGTQNQDILGGSGGTITVDFSQTNPISCPDNEMGFIANIQPAACMNGVNETTDDSEAAYTCVDNSIIVTPSCEAEAPVISLNN